MKFKKLTSVLALATIAVTLSGCSDDDQSQAPKQQTTGNFLNPKVKANSDKIQTKNLSITHNITFDGQTIPLVATYKIQKDFANNWWFSDTESINLGLKPTKDLSDASLSVSGVYADVSTASKWTQYNAIRQDSLNKSLNNTPDTAGYSIDKNNGYDTLFQVEPIDLTSTTTTVWIYNGYGDTTKTTHKISEDDIRQTVYAARLRVVWTLVINKNGKHYEKSINDNILIPYLHAKSASPK